MKMITEYLESTEFVSNIAANMKVKMNRKIKNGGQAYFLMQILDIRQEITGWMKLEPLRRKLELLGWKPYQKVLTPKQVACIIDHVGEPDIDLINNLNSFKYGKV